MSTLAEKTDLLIRESLSALDELIAHSHAVKGWNLLQERNREGDAVGPLPYTDEALKEFQAALAAFPDNAQILHHLAIGHHARAWDWELQADSRAPREWELALGYWRRLATSSEFWTEQARKLNACDRDASPNVLNAAKKDLFENLLEVHVDFICHYFQLDQPDRATEHVNIIRRSKIPQAVRNRLVEKVYEAMTASVAQAALAQRHESALLSLEQFLSLFPEQPHIGALRKHAELCTAWLSRLSCQDAWDTIRLLSQRALPMARCLATHQELELQPLARTALDELTSLMALRGHDRGATYFANIDKSDHSPQERQEATQCLELSIEWARLGYAKARNNSVVRKLLPASLHLHAACLHGAAFEEEQNSLEKLPVDQSAFDILDPKRIRNEAIARITRALDLSRLALADLLEAVGYEPNEPILVEHLDAVKSQVSQLESELNSIAGEPR